MRCKMVYVAFLDPLDEWMKKLTKGCTKMHNRRMPAQCRLIKRLAYMQMKTEFYFDFFFEERFFPVELQWALS